MQHSNLAQTVVMVPPTDFGFNPQTADDNDFQHVPTESAIEVTARAMQEFEEMVEKLKRHDLQILLMEKEDDHVTPDAVFPNNWFLTTPDGGIFFFPMKTENRRREVRPKALCHLFVKNGFTVNYTVHLGGEIEDRPPLEGTGALVFDHMTDTVFAAMSERCDLHMLQQFQKFYRSKKVISFPTMSSTGHPVYHTNVMLSIGVDFAVICPDVIAPTHLQKVLGALSVQHKSIIKVTEEQMNQFCCNILQLKNKKGDRIIVMSTTALNAFTTQQKNTLSCHGKIIAVDIPTIESVGGGSARCMIADVRF